MLGNEWVLTEGCTDLENNCERVAARAAADEGITVAYIALNSCYQVTLKGVFDICPMAATGYTQEQVRESLPIGYVAVPIMVGTTALVLQIGPDYELNTIKDEEDVIAKGIVDIDDVVEAEDPSEIDEDLRRILEV